MKRLVIKDQESLDEFENLTDTDLILDILLTKHKWNGRSYKSTGDALDFVERVFGNRDFGTSKTGCNGTWREINTSTNKYGHYYYSYNVPQEDYANVYSIRYNNLNADITINFKERIATFEYSHLRKNTKRDISLILDTDGIYYLRFKWQDFYSEVKRINKREKTTHSKTEIKKLGLDFKIDNLLVKLEEKGFSSFTASKTSEYNTRPSLSVYKNYSNIRIWFPKIDKGNEIEVANETTLEIQINNSGILEYTFPEALELLEKYKNVIS
jgi:hypothetical protein